MTQPISYGGRPLMPAPGAPTPELRVAQFRGHARRLVWSALVLIVVAGACGWFYDNLPAPFENWMMLAAAGAVVFLLVAPAVPRMVVARLHHHHPPGDRALRSPGRRRRELVARAGIHDRGAARHPAADVGRGHADALERRGRAAAARRTSRASISCTRRSSIRSRSTRSSPTAMRSRCRRRSSGRPS